MQKYFSNKSTPLSLYWGQNTAKSQRNQLTDRTQNKWRLRVISMMSQEEEKIFLFSKLSFPGQ